MGWLKSAWKGTKNVAKKIGKGAAKFGEELVQVPGYAVGKVGDAADYLTGADDLKKGFKEAQKGYQAMGAQAETMYKEGEGRALGEYDKSQSVADSNRAQLGGPGYLEQFYSDNAARQGQLKFAQDQAARANADAFAGRGLNNSTIAVEYENRARQGLLGDYLKMEGELAGGADVSKRGRLKQMYDEQFALSDARSGIISESTKNRVAAMTDAEKQRLAAYLAEQGVDRETINMILGFGIEGAKVAVAAG